MAKKRYAVWYGKYGDKYKEVLADNDLEIHKLFGWDLHQFEVIKNNKIEKLEKKLKKKAGLSPEGLRYGKLDKNALRKGKFKWTEGSGDTIVGV